jgi:hypothetical protein
MKTRQDAADQMEAELRNAVRGRNQEDVSLAYSRLGLLPEKTDLRHALLSFYSSQALAFYDSRAKEIVVIDNTQERPTERRPGKLMTEPSPMS